MGSNPTPRTKTQPTGLQDFEEFLRTRLTARNANLAEATIQTRLRAIKMLQKRVNLWDICDNLQDLFEKKSRSFRYAYYLFLSDVLRLYSRYLGGEYYSPVRVYELMTDAGTQKKYFQREFPDRVFCELFVEALSVTDESLMLECFISLVDHVFKETGGFTLDGWKIRTPLELK